jgi:hypothetical protein
MGPRSKTNIVDRDFCAKATLAKGFFDHLIRHSESHSEKWEYVYQNPLPAGLVQQPESWPFQGEIESMEAL